VGDSLTAEGSSKEDAIQERRDPTGDKGQAVIFCFKGWTRIDVVFRHTGQFLAWLILGLGFGLSFTRSLSTLKELEEGGGHGCFVSRRLIVSLQGGIRRLGPMGVLLTGQNVIVQVGQLEDFKGLFVTPREGDRRGSLQGVQEGPEAASHDDLARGDRSKKLDGKEQTPDEDQGTRKDLHAKGQDRTGRLMSGGEGEGISEEASGGEPLKSTDRAGGHPPLPTFNQLTRTEVNTGSQGDRPF
jgi:hypothetical protein